MDWYDRFNAIEAGLWFLVAAALPFRARSRDGRQQTAVRLASVAFVIFGISDLCELGREGRLPLWLWALKSACAAALLFARMHWLGWHQFSWRMRELWFAILCLLAVLGMILLQTWLCAAA